jgi:hypothetical protein
MTMPSSGALYASTIRSEFRFGGNIGTNRFYSDNTDPYLRTIPTSGQIAYNQLYGASVRTARLTGGSATTSFTSGTLYRRCGYSVSNGSREWHPESGSQTNAFGSATRRNYLSTTAAIGGIHAFYNGPAHKHITISHQSSSNSGWTYMDFKTYDYSNNLMTGTIQRGASMSGGTYRGFKRQSGNSTQRQYYHWSWSQNGYNIPGGTFRNLFLGLIFSYQYGKQFWVRFR